MRSNRQANIHLHFHGALANDFQDYLLGAVFTPEEAVKLLECNCPGTIEKWFRRALYTVVVNGKPITKKSELHKKLKPGDRIDFVPVVAGGLGPLEIIGIVVGVLLIASVFFLRPKFNNTDLDAESKRFQPSANVSEEGIMVPVIYGTVRTGSVRASSGRLATQQVAGLDNDIIPFRDPDAYLDGLFGDGFISNGTLPDGTVQRSGLYPSTRGTDGVLRGGSITTTVIDIISEGPCGGPQDDVNGARSILLDGTRLQNDDGSNNFVAIMPDWTLGTDPQDNPNVIRALQVNTTPVDFSGDISTDRLVRTLSQGIDSFTLIFSVASFFETRKGKPRATSVQLIIEISETGSGNWTEIGRPSVSGEYFSEQLFPATYYIDNSIQYDLSIRRANSETINEEKSDRVSVNGLNETINSRVRFDGRSLAFIKYTEETADGNNPEIEYIWIGRLIEVPSNYNLNTKTFVGPWNGTWTFPNITTIKQDRASDNPAFICRDILTNTKYGLGRKTRNSFDEFALYSIGQFCDQLVPDGKGGSERRYTFNGAIRDRELAIQVLQNVSSTFNGAPYWNGRSVDFAIEQDGKQTKYIATNANVIEGFFNYTGQEIDARPNSISVTYLDKSNNYEETQTTYRNHADVRANGLIETQIDGVLSGFTTESQALRAARYFAFTQGQVVNFTSTEYFSDAIPGDIVEVFDSKWDGERLGGLVSGYNNGTKQLTLDFPRQFSTGDMIAVAMPDGTAFTTSIVTTGNTNAITLQDNLPLTPVYGAPYGVIKSGGVRNLYQIQSRSEASNGEYEIVAIEYDPLKISKIENNIVSNPVTRPPNLEDRFVSPPSTIVVVSEEVADPQGTRYNLKINWQAPVGQGGVIGYDVFYSIDGGQSRSLAANINATFTVLENAQEGVYVFFVRAITSNAKSRFTSLRYVFEDIAPRVIPVVTGLELFGQGNNTVFSNRDAKFVWNDVSALLNDEFGSERFGASSAFRDNQFKDYIIRIIANGRQVREEQGIIIPQYIYSLEKNVEDGGPYRTFTIEVYSRDKYNNVSLPASLTVRNPAPALPTNVIATGSLGSFFINFDFPQGELDVVGAILYSSNISGFVPDSNNIVADVLTNTISLDAESSETRYFRLAVYDTYGKNGLNISSEFSATSKSQFDEEDFSLAGVDFQANGNTNTVNWTSGVANVRIGDQQNQYNISSGNSVYNGSRQYIYYVFGETIFRVTNSIVTATQVGQRIVAWYEGGTRIVSNNAGGVIIDGDRITAGTISAANLVAGQAVITGTAQIADAIVTNAKIGNVIQSSNFNNSTKQGWRLSKDGTIEGRSIIIYDNLGLPVFSSGGAFLSAINDAGAFAGIDQITLGNASTYIANAAIGAAQIGSLNAGVITTGTLNADRINIDNITLDTVGGELVIANGGVNTTQISTNAVTDTDVAIKSTTQLMSNTQNLWQNVTGLLLSNLSSGSGTMILLQGNITGYSSVRDGDRYGIDLRVTRNGSMIGSEVMGFHGKGDYDVTNEPQPLHFNAPFNILISGSSTPADYQVQLQITSNGAGGFSLDPAFLWRISSGAIVATILKR